MSDPSFSDTLSYAKEQHRKSTAVERDWWNRSSSVEKRRILGQIDFNDIGTHYETATENAYQRDNTANINQLVNENYDSLPEPVKANITETLIAMGELPNPSVYKGISNMFAVGKEVWHECDRCDESFMDEEDFAVHTEVDHGDSEELKEEAEEGFAFSMDPEVSRYALHEARKALAETKEEDLHRKNYFNGDSLDFPTTSEPSADDTDAGGNTIAGTQGYNANPNDGLYDYVDVKEGSSKDRYALEADNYPRDHKENPDWEEDFEDIKANLEHSGEADNYPSDHKTNPDWDDDFQQLKSDYEDRDTPVSYEVDGVSDITALPDKEDKDDGLEYLDEMDLGYDEIESYPTKAQEGKQKSYITEAEADIQEEYAQFGQEDSEDEQVTEMITERKMAGYSPETIANEIRIMYGVSPEDAFNKVTSVEVSINDRIANTFFQKKFNECNEQEKEELAMYTGADEE